MPNWKKLITSGSNAVLNDITASGEILIPQYIEHLGDTDTKLGFSAGNTIVLVTGGSTRLKTNNSGAQVTGSLQVSGDITTADEINLSSDKKVNFGASSEIESTTSGTKLLLNASDEVHLRRGGSTKLRVQSSGVEITGLIDATKEKQIIHTNGEVLKAAETTGYIPFANINQIDGDVQTGYWQYVVPVDGYVEKVIVSPHQAATSGTVGLTWKNQSGNLGSEVNGTISATAGVPTTFNFGSSYNFSANDRLNLFIDRGATARSRGFGFTIILRLDFVS